MVGPALVVEGVADRVERGCERVNLVVVHRSGISQRDQRSDRRALHRGEGSFRRGRLGRRRQRQAVLTHALHGVGEIEDHRQGALQQAHHGQLAGGSVRFTGQLVVGGESAQPQLPLAFPAVHRADLVDGYERLVPGLDRRRRIGGRAVQLGVALAHQCERVLVRAEPDVQSVLFDTAVVAAARRGLTAQSPSALVHGDRLEAITPAGFAQSPRGGQPCHATAQDGDAFLAAGHPRSCHSGISTTTVCRTAPSVPFAFTATT